MTDSAVLAESFEGTTQIEAFTQAHRWLAARDGQATVLDVSWKIYPDSPNYELKVYFIPE